MIRVKAGPNYPIPFVLDDTSSTVGAPLTGIAYNTSGLVARWKRSVDSNWTTMTLVAGSSGTYVSNGFLELGQGAYEICPASGAFGSGYWLIVQLYGATNMKVTNLYIDLVEMNLQGTPSVNVAQWLGTAVQNSAGGLPPVLVSGMVAQVLTDVVSGVWSATGNYTSGSMANAAILSRGAAAGKWVVNTAANTLTMYDIDGSTILKTFNLTPTGGPYTTRTPT